MSQHIPSFKKDNYLRCTKRITYGGTRKSHRRRTALHLASELDVVDKKVKLSESAICRQHSKSKFSPKAVTVDCCSCNSSPHSSSLDDYTVHDTRNENENHFPATTTPASLSPSSSQHPHLSMPPGPHTSPVPSPPPPFSAYEDCLLTNNNVNSTGNGNRMRLRRRRNAVCGTNSLGRGLRDFLVSYVVSNLSESMTSSLNLQQPNSNSTSNITSRSNSVNQGILEEEEDDDGDHMS